jgi:WD40 repeat protein
MSCVAIGTLLTFAAFLARAQEPIALRCAPSGKVWNNVHGLSFSLDSRWLAAGMNDKIVLWDVSTREIAAEFSVRRNSVRCLAFTRDGHTLVAGHSDGTIRVWDGSRGWAETAEGESIEAPVVEGPKPRNIAEEREQVAQVAFSEDGEILAWSSFGPANGHRVHLWKWSTRQELDVLPIGDVISDQRFQLRGNLLVVVVAGNRRLRRGPEIHVWDTATRTLTQRLPVPAVFIGGMRISPDGKLLAGVLNPGPARQTPTSELVVWELATGKSVSFGRGPHRWLFIPAFSPDGRTLAVGTFSNPSPPCPSTVLLFDVTTGRQRNELRPPRAGTAPWELAFSPDGQYLAAGMCFDEVPVFLWRLSSSAPVATPLSPGNDPFHRSLRPLRNDAPELDPLR